MNNPFAPPAAATAAGSTSLRLVGDRYFVRSGFWSSKQYHGKVYANGDYIALCGVRDLGAQGLAAVFGVIGILVYAVLRKRRAPVDPADLPDDLAEQMLIDGITPVAMTVIGKSEIVRLRYGLFHGVRIETAALRCGVSKGIFGGKRVCAALTELGWQFS